MPRERVLITVKTYPCPSSTYVELVCMAGIRENGSWIRIYPYPFRRLKQDKHFEKYSWVEIDIEKNKSDIRPESFRPIDWHSVKSISRIGTGDDWAERRRLLIEKGTVYTDLQELISKAKQNELSLAVFKPTEILDFKAEPAEREWNGKKLEKALAELSQSSLFKDDFNEYFELAKKVPYKFSYVFKDIGGKNYNLMIEDWEVCQLYWNCLERNNKDEKLAVADVRKKYFDQFLNKCDLYFFLGTTLQWHLVAPNPFIIIGAFYPPKLPPEKQLELNFE
jgi:hypothetical protein